MRHTTPQISKMVRDLALESYGDNGYLHDHVEYDVHGAFRAVRVFDGFAIKFARASYQAVQNRAEWDTYRKFPESVKTVAAKPICISKCGRVMAIEAVTTTLRAAHRDDNRGGGQPEWWETEQTELCEFNEKLLALLTRDGGFSDDEIRTLMCDNHGNNIGVRENGELCWIDYAAYAE